MKGITSIAIQGEVVVKTFDLKTELGRDGYDRELEMFQQLTSLELCPELLDFTDDTIIMRWHQPLKAWMSQVDRAEWPFMARRIYEQILELESRQIHHRDMHRNNLVIRPDGVPLFIDFEFAIRQDAISYDLYGPEISGVPPHRLHERPAWWQYWDARNPLSLGRQFKVKLKEVASMQPSSSRRAPQ